MDNVTIILNYNNGQEKFQKNYLNQYKAHQNEPHTLPSLLSVKVDAKPFFRSMEFMICRQANCFLVETKRKLNADSIRQLNNKKGKGAVPHVANVDNL